MSDSWKKDGKLILNSLVTRADQRGSAGGHAASLETVKRWGLDSRDYIYTLVLIVSYHYILHTAPLKHHSL